MPNNELHVHQTRKHQMKSCKKLGFSVRSKLSTSILIFLLPGAWLRAQR